MFLKFIERAYFGLSILSILGGIIGVASQPTGTGSDWYYLFMGIIAAVIFAGSAQTIRTLRNIQSQVNLQTKILKRITSKNRNG